MNKNFIEMYWNCRVINQEPLGLQQVLLRLSLISLERRFRYEKNRLMDYYCLLGYKSDTYVGIFCNGAYPFMVRYLDSQRYTSLARLCE